MRFLLILLLFTSCTSHKFYYKGSKSDHFDGERFISKSDEDFSNEPHSLLTFKDNWDDGKEKITPTKFNTNEPVVKSRITFVGHSTFLIQLSDLNILTDPIWSNRPGPIALPLFAPKRHNQPAIAFDDLPKIDFVLLSNSSYYHMDIPTLKKLKKKFNPTFVTGLGNCYYLNQVKNLDLRCFELDWNQKMTLPNTVSFVFLTTQNWSQRSWFDLNKTLWGSFAILAPELKIYFAGDITYSPEFPETSQKYAPFDITLLPVDSYEPRWLMQRKNLNAQESAQAHINLQSRKSIASHFNGKDALEKATQKDGLWELH